MTVYLSILFALAVLVLVAAVWFDVKRFELPNTLSLLMIGLFVLAAVPQLNAQGWVLHLASAGVMFVFGFVSWRLHLMGGGDVKFWAACALWFELSILPYQIVAVAAVGGALAIGLLAARHGIAAYARSAGRPALVERLPRGLKVGGPVPYGVAIALGSLWALTAHAPDVLVAVFPAE